MLIPAGFHFAYSSTTSSLTDEEEKADVLKMSRGVAIILLGAWAPDPPPEKKTTR